MSSAQTVAVIVATYNRQAELGICLLSLLSQTTPPGAIYVIDNFSTDAIGEMVRRIGDRRIRYFRLLQNTGSAGGFRAGMELAFNDGFEWLWITDNDSVPHRDSLEALLHVAEENEGVLAFAPVKHHNRDARILNCDCIWDRTNDTVRCPTDEEYRKRELVDVDWVANTGLLVHRKLVALAGYPRADLFAFGEDTEYCLRLRRYSRILVATKSVVVHPDMGMGWPVPLQSLRKLYYVLRNEVYLSIRGLKRPRWTIFDTFWHWFRMSLNIIGKQDHPMRRLFVVTLAMVHGLVGRLGSAPKVLES